MDHTLPRNTTLRTGAASRALRILIAEDDPDIGIPYKIALEERGHSVDLAQNGEICVEIYKAALKDVMKQKNSGEGKRYRNYAYNGSSSGGGITSNNSAGQALSYSSSDLIPASPPPFDALVLDYRMPKKDGLEVAKEILTLNPSQRIIFASAYVKETLEKSVKELRQVVELIQKPFLPEALVDIIEDTEAYPELEKLFANVKKMSEIDFENPKPDQIREIFEGLKKIRKGRTF